jgi:hypothetical protein
LTIRLGCLMGGKLVTPQEAGTYVTKLPKAEHEAPEWQAAMEALILVATLGGPTMFARIGVIGALNLDVQRVFNPLGARSPVFLFEHLVGTGESLSGGKRLRLIAQSNFIGCWTGRQVSHHGYPDCRL